MNALIRDGTLRYVRSLEATCDVTIICQHNVKLMAHKIVLGIGSTLLQDILLDCRTCQNMTILLPQVPSKLISLVLDFVYTGSIILTTENDYKDFLEVANMLKLHNIDIKQHTNEINKKHPHNDNEIDNVNNTLESNNGDATFNDETDTSGKLVPLLRITHARRLKEVRNKVMPSPWKSRSPRHFVDWNYNSQCSSSYSGMNDSNNNIAVPVKDCNVGEQVLSLATSSYPAIRDNIPPINEANVRRACNNYESELAKCNNVETSTKIRENVSHQINVSTLRESKINLDRTVLVSRCGIASVHGTGFGQDDSADTSKMNKNEDEKRNKVYTCKECGKTFTQLRNYKYHRSIHDGSGEFAAKCLECGKTFNDRGYLRSHMKIHTDKKEYACNFCPKRFNQRVAYNMHSRIHTGVKPHECATCGKSFSRKMLLKQHERVHTGEKPFICPQCGKSFADRSNMMLHARLHTGEKPYTCNICQKSFAKKHHLKTHINFHTGIKPYACNNCGLTFSQSSNMKTHFKKCEKPYTCNICQKSFAKKHHLKTHINFHTGIKSYACNNCGLTFSQSSNMKTHFKKCNGHNNASKNKRNN